MNEMSSSAMNLSTSGSTMRGGPAVVGEFAGAALILGLAGAAIWLLATTLAAGVPEGPDRPVQRGSGEAAFSGPPRLVPPHLAPHLFIVVGSEARASELREDLGREARLRTALGEQPRDAEVVVVGSDEEAAIVADEISRQANIPGIEPMAATLVQ